MFAELNALYSQAITKLNKSFLKNASSRNLPVLFAALGADNNTERQNRIVRDYYDFTVRKTYKNMGFSLASLRENILLLPEAAFMKEKSYDTTRSKLYMLMDFVIFDRYRNEPSRIDNLVNSLRASQSDVEKENIYRKEAQRVWKEMGGVIKDQIASRLSASMVKSIRPVKLSPDILSKSLIKDDTNSFCKLIYLVTRFQDGKEINELLTTLINKFENIQSLLQVMKDVGLSCSFAAQYSLLANSGEIAADLRLINSFARMERAEIATKEELFCDAARLLGATDSDADLKKQIHALLDKDNGPRDIRGNRDFGFRNFIINNVLESRRFNYLVRYGNPVRLRKLAANKNVVAFVLKGIPDAQIVRYFNSCLATNREYFPEMRDELAGMLTKLNFSDYLDVKTNIRVISSREAIETERKKSLVRLYLTVLYLAVKNLVYINSRYFLGFHCAERDSALVGFKLNKDDWAAFAKSRVEQNRLNGRATQYVMQNMVNSDPNVVYVFRNAVAHMNVVNYASNYIGDIGKFDSYFELYHYLLQRWLIDAIKGYCDKEWLKMSDVNPVMRGYFDKVLKYRTYCKDMVKALNVPFAYNLPRYKNLSIRELFDRNEFLPEKGKADALRPEDAAETSDA